jgi:hypothetical protein
MPGDDLITAYLRDVARGLPAGTVEELTDGLYETYEHHLAAGVDDQAAAQAAIAEFGDAGQIADAFVRDAPGRRAARRLLVTGPAVGVCWGAALIVARLWTWHIPVTARLGVGTALAIVVLILATAATSRHSYRRTRLAIVGGAGLVVLDAVMITGVLVLAPALTWLLIAAILVSVGRIGFAVRSLPRTLVR